MLAGQKSIRQCLVWAESNKKWLKNKAGIRSIPSASTVSRMLWSIDEEEAVLAFMEWVTSIVDASGSHLIIDGKGLRAAARKNRNEKTPYVLNVLEAGTRLVLAQLSIPDKTNEITAIPKLLKLLYVKGNTITIDAIGTQTEIARIIDEAGGTYLMTVKKNQPELYDELMWMFDSPEHEKLKAFGVKTDMPSAPNQTVFEKLERNRGRVEHRLCTVWTRQELFCNRAFDFSGIKSVGMMKRIRRETTRDKEGNDITPSEEEYLRRNGESDSMSSGAQTIGIISNREIDAEAAASTLRDHWLIENSLHHVLDTELDEDHSTCRKSRNVMALLRKYVYNIIRLFSSGKGCDMSSGRTYFRNDMELVGRYVFEGIPSLY